MRLRCLVAFAIVTSIAVTDPARADLVSFYPPFFDPESLDIIGSGVSADGNVAVGWGSDEDFGPVRATPSGTHGISGTRSDGRAEATSADGSVTVGGSVFFSWRSVGSGPAQPLPSLPGGEDEEFPSAYDVSADGSLIVGASYYGASAATQAVLWTNGIAEPLGFLSSDVVSVANAISADGSVIAGWSGSQGVAWLGGAPAVSLGDLAGGGATSRAFGVSADGSTIVGQGTSGSGSEAFRWTAGGGMQGLGDLAGGAFSSTALDASADGAWIVGSASAAGGTTGFVWHQPFGMKSIHEFLVDDWGLFVDVGWIFYSASAISDDGTTIVGTAYNPELGGTAGFIATIPEPATGLLLGAALAALGRPHRPRSRG
jgi:uncharacterized membrane protein